MNKEINFEEVLVSLWKSTKDLREKLLEFKQRIRIIQEQIDIINRIQEDISKKNIYSILDDVKNKGRLNAEIDIRRSVERGNMDIISKRCELEIEKLKKERKDLIVKLKDLRNTYLEIREEFILGFDDILLKSWNL